MELISDKDGVDVIIAPVKELDGFQTNIDFNFATKALYDIDNRSKKWNLSLKDGATEVGQARFTAFQFLADGIERRTISLEYIEVHPKQRGKKKSYDVTRAIIETVNAECDTAWDKVSGAPVMFVEKKSLLNMPEADRAGLFSFLKKLAEVVFGFNSKPQPIPEHDLVVTAIGDDVTIQLIEGHLLRSAKAENSNPGGRRK